MTDRANHFFGTLLVSELGDLSKAVKWNIQQRQQQQQQ